MSRKFHESMSGHGPGGAFYDASLTGRTPSHPNMQHNVPKTEMGQALIEAARRHNLAETNSALVEVTDFWLLDIIMQASGK